MCRINASEAGVLLCLSTYTQWWTVTINAIMAHFHYTVGLGHARYGSVRLGRVGP